MTFEEAHKKLLQRLDVALSDLRFIHADTDHVNSESADCKQAHQNLKEAESDLFRLKNVWKDATSTRPPPRVGKG